VARNAVKKAVSPKPAENAEALDDDSFAGRQFITALARGLDVLGAFRIGDPPLSNQELADRCRLPRPTISRISHTLTELGYLSYHDDFGCYQSGGAVLTLGHVAQGNFEGFNEALPEMIRLAEFSNANVGVGARDRLTMTYLTVVKGPAGIGLRFETGSKVPILPTAMGRAYLAGAGDENLQVLKSRLLKKYRDDVETVHRTIEAAQAEYKATGYCSSAGGWHGNINGIAAPIPWPAAADTLVVNVGAPTSMMPKERMLKEVGPHLVATVQEIGNILQKSGESLLHSLRPPPSA
jgi:DNA-binding IclR family transcriptional regulator